MRRYFAIFCLWLISAATAQAEPSRTMVQISLHSQTATVHPGQTLRVAVRQKIAPRWHTYWINPGDAGEPMALEWSLPDGFKAGEIEWPLPEAIPVASLTNFGYSNEAVFLVTVNAPETLSGDKVQLSVKARWLVCEEVCIPEEGTAKLSLGVVGSAADAMESSEAGLITKAVRQLPVVSPWPAAFLADEDRIQLSVNGIAASLTPLNKPMFFPLSWGQVRHEVKQQAAIEGDDLRLNLGRGELKTQPLKIIKGLLIVETEEGGTTARRGYWLEAANSGETLKALPSPTGGGGPFIPDGETRAETEGIGLPTAMLFAVLGGLILNLMPCVFPVLSLKAFSLAGQSPGEGRRHGAAYFAGVMASFAALAVVLIALRSGGSLMGWGFQFQSPQFVLAMAVLFFGLGLSMSGVFTLGAGVMGVGDHLVRRGGTTGSFFTGVLAALAATPCTAPFMGAALGYALMRPAAEMALVVMALGFGFALPMVLLSMTPAVLRLLPRPGAWMETLKQVLAFPLYATAGWLVWVLSVQTGSDGVVAAVMALTGIGFAAWLWGRAQAADLGFAHIAAPVAALAVLIVATTLVPAGQPPESGVKPVAGSAVATENFTRQRLAELRQLGRPVFVNFTAAWCITCKVNESVALKSADVQRAFAEQGIVYMTGDWTKYNPEITAVLRSFGRAGVPLYVFYPGSPADAEPVVLPQLLTPDIVLSSLRPSPQTQAKGEPR